MTRKKNSSKQPGCVFGQRWIRWIISYKAPPFGHQGEYVKMSQHLLNLHVWIIRRFHLLSFARVDISVHTTFASLLFYVSSKSFTCLFHTHTQPTDKFFFRLEQGLRDFRHLVSVTRTVSSKLFVLLWLDGTNEVKSRKADAKNGTTKINQAGLQKAEEFIVGQQVHTHEFNLLIFNQKLSLLKCLKTFTDIQIWFQSCL